MPSNEFIFMDNGIFQLNHYYHRNIFKILESSSSVNRKDVKGRKTDLETALYNHKNSKLIWGEGEIRLLIKK